MTAINPSSTTPEYQPTQPVNYQNTRVLVVDDEFFNREIVEDLLHDIGIETVMSANGKEAIGILDNVGHDAFDLVLMDVQMPEMDGLTATRQIRSREKHQSLPIIALTAHTTEQDKIEVRQAGMNDHIPKPFKVENFYRTLARWIPQMKQRHAKGRMPQPHTPFDIMPAIEGIDTESALALFGDNRESYRFWLLGFADDGERNARLLTEAINSGDINSASLMAHNLKGRLGMFGMQSLHLLASDLDQSLRKANSKPDAIRQLAEELLKGITTICARISIKLGRPAADNPIETNDSATRGQPLPDFFAPLIELLISCDSSSADAIAACLSEHQDSLWASRLRIALNHARRFDFAAARKALTQ